MKKYVSKIIYIMIIITISAYLPVISSTAQEAERGKPADKKDEAAAPKLKYLENVLFEKLPGKERVSLIVSEQPVIKAEGQTNGSLLVKLEDTSAPENLRQGLGEGQLNNISRVTPSERRVNGKQWIYLMIDIKHVVPYSIRQEGKNVTIDFNIASLPEKKPPVSPPIAAKKIPQVTPKRAEAAVEKIQPIKKEVAERYIEKKIFIDFQDADIKHVLRAMAEWGNVSIVSGDDVKGTITLSMKNVPWEQALDAILEIHGLAKRQMGNVIIVSTLAIKKKNEEDRVKDEVAKGKLQQILIEAKIVEATEVFIRNIGVKWGFGGQSIGGYGSKIAGGTNTVTTNSWASPYPSTITATDSSGNPLHMAAVNMASALASPTFGVVIGAGTAFLEAQLAALETTTTGKIISAPRVVTMDNIKATIKQGDEVPFITPGTTSSPATVSFKEALLRLDVKPKITAEGKISMEIKMTNDVPNYALAATLQGNPPIRKNEIESTVVINDGDTIVIGGIMRTEDDLAVSGLPWLQKIPVLGWLFKTENITKNKRQLLIFVTPKILKSGNFAESPEKIIN